MKQLLTRGGVPRDPDHRCHVQEEKKKDDSNVAPFLRPGLLHAPTFC